LALSFSRRLSSTKAYYNMIRHVAFPRSTSTIVVMGFAFSAVGMGLSFLIAQRSLMSFVTGALWGVLALVLPSFLSSVFLYFTIMKEDPLFYLRRCVAFSFFTILVWVVIFLACSFLALVPSFVFPGFAVIMGLFAVMPLRSAVVFSMSKTSFARRTLFALAEPTFTAFSVVLIFGEPFGRVAFGLVLSSLLGLAFAFALITTIEFQGRRAIGISPIRMFRAFLTDWLEAKNGELEACLNDLGIEERIDVATFGFRRKTDRKMKSVILVSTFHPGPFLNIGSSVMPFLFSSVMQRRYGAVGVVPHGVSGHELNLVSQEQNARVIEWVLENLNTAKYIGSATTVRRSTNDLATATCQVFDGSAMVTMTAAPYDMEDIPSELASHLNTQTFGRFRHLALIDAHNSLTQETIMPPERVAALEQAALSSLESIRDEAHSSFKVGVAHRIPREFTLKDGFGPGGIVVIGIEVGEQRFAYITIDGNNMVKGLREDILATARQVGFQDGEVMTTDTHMVNGVVSAPLGYHLVGEVVPRSILLNHINAACQEAIGGLEPCEVGVVSGQLVLKTLGSNSFKRVMTLVYKNAKLTSLTLFPIAIILAALSLIFLV
jgi:putative membrane protein